MLAYSAGLADGGAYFERSVRISLVYPNVAIESGSGHLRIGIIAATAAAASHADVADTASDEAGRV